MMENQVVTVSQMKEIERRAADSGLSYYQMMENAGTAAFNYMIQMIPGKKHTVLIFCGKGNNGGDGFVVARKFKEAEAAVRIVLVDGEPTTEDAKRNRQLCDSLKIPILDMRVNAEEAAGWIETADIIIDAIYGTGFRGKFNETACNAARFMNGATAPVISLDIPSGLNGDSGEAAADAVRADYTIAFHRYKPVHEIRGSKPYCGKLFCADIGISI